MDLDDTQVLDFENECNETEEEQDVKEERNQVGQLKVFRTKDFEEKIYDIFEGENFIGRDESCDVYLPRKSLSKTHACIEVSEELHLIYDDNSKNRTKRDKTILKPQVRYELHHGDMLTLADTKCQYIKGKIEQDNDDDETGSETGSESMLPKGSAIPSSNKDTSKKKDAFAADTDSETDEEKNPVNIKKTVVYSPDEKLDKPDVAEDSYQPKPMVPAFMYDSSDDDDDDNERASKHEGQKSSSDIKAQMDVSADSGTLAFGLVSPGDVPIIRPTSKKVPDIENTPLTLVYSPDTQDYTPDNPSILSKGREEGSSCAPTLIYGSESPYQEKSPIKHKRSDQPDAAELSDEDPSTSKTSHDKNVSKTQREIASCPETLPVQEIESLKENPFSDVVPSMRGTDKLKETPLNDMPTVGETPSEFNVFLPETQGFSPGNEDISLCEPTQAYLQESPIDTPKDTPGEMVSDVTSIPDSQEEGEQSQSESDVKKVLSYGDDSATQAYTWNDSDATGDEDDELRFQATQAYPCHLKQLENDMEPKPESFPSKEDDEVEQGSDVQEQDSSSNASSSPHLDMQQTIAYDVAEMDTQAYDTGKDGNTGIEPTVPYNIMDMETQAYEAETEESTSPASELDNPSAAADRDSRGARVEPTLPYNLGTETQDFDNEKDTSKNADDGNPAIEATVPYDIEMGTQAYTGKDIEDSQTDDEGSLEQKEGKMPDIMETQAYGAVDEAQDKEDSETDDEGNLEKNEGKVPDIMETQAYGAVDEAQDVDKAGPSNLDDVCAETQAYGLEVQATSPATDDMIPDSDEALSQEIPLNRIGEDDDTVNNNVPDKTFTTQQVEENRDEDEGEEEVAIIVRPKRRGKGRVTQSSTEENQQPAMPDKAEGTTLKEISVEIRREARKSPNESETAPEDAGLKRPTRGKKSKRNIEVKAKVIREPSVNDSEEDEFQPDKGTRERRSTRGKTSKKKKVDDVEEETSVSKRTTARVRRSKKTEVEAKEAEDAEDEQQRTPSMAEKKVIRNRRSKKPELETKVPEDTEEEHQETASMTEKRRGRHPKKSEAEMRVPEDTEEEQQETASMTEKRRGRHPKKSEAETRAQDDTEEQEQETPPMTEKRTTRGRHLKKSEAEMKVPEDTEESAFVTDKRTTKGRHPKKSKVEARVQEDTVEEQQESSSMSEKNSARGRRSKKSGVKPTSIENVLPDDTDEDLDVPVKKSLRGRRSAKEDKEVEKEEKTQQVEEKEVSVPEKLVQDSPKSDDEELPSLELILSEKKPMKGKGKRKGKTKEPETPVLLSSKVEIPSVTIEVKPYFPRRGRGRVTQSDESASAVPDTSGTQLTEFEEEELISPRSVARSISARKGMKGKKEDESQEYAEMDTSVPQSTPSSPIESKTRKRERKEEARVATDLDESQSSVASSVGRKARGKRSGKNAKASDADDIHSQSASQASDVSAASSVESRTRGKGRRKTARSGTMDDTQEQEVQETPTKKGRTIKDEADSPTVHSPSLRERKPQTPPKVMFTGVSDKQAEKIVTSLGGTLVDSVYECTHLITDKVRRTVKFLCGVASGQMIVQPQWLTACKKAKHFIEPVPFIVSDKAAEKQYSFSLQQSLEKAQSGGLLEEYKIHITKSVKPEPSQMKDIIKSAKGEYLPRMPRTNVNNVLVVSCEEDQDLCKPALACGLPVYSSELLLTGVLRQELELDQNRLFSSEEEGKRKRKEYGDSETPVKSASRKRKKK